MLCRLSLAACAVAIVANPAFPRTNESIDDPIAKITTTLPKGWKVELATHYRDCIIRIQTNSIETEPSHYSSDDKSKNAPVLIEFKLLPRYSRGMLKRIYEHNRPFLARLKSTNRLSAERQSIEAQMIPYPMYQDAQYSYIVLPPARVPAKNTDMKVLQEVLKKITSGWKAIDKEVTPVEDIPVFFTNK